MARVGSRWSLAAALEVDQTNTVCQAVRGSSHYDMAQLMPLPLTVSCFSKIQIGFTFLVPAYPDSPGKRAIKRVCVCTCTFLQSKRSGAVSGAHSGQVCWVPCEKRHTVVGWSSTADT